MCTSAPPRGTRDLVLTDRAFVVRRRGDTQGAIARWPRDRLTVARCFHHEPSDGRLRMLFAMWATDSDGTRIHDITLAGPPRPRPQRGQELQRPDWRSGGAGRSTPGRIDTRSPFSVFFIKQDSEAVQRDPVLSVYPLLRENRVCPRLPHVDGSPAITAGTPSRRPRRRRRRWPRVRRQTRAPR